MNTVGPRRVSLPSTTNSSWKSFRPSLPKTLCFLWLCGSIFQIMQWIVGYRQLLRVQLAAEAAPAFVNRLVDELTLDENVVVHGVSVTDGLAAPSVAGLLQSSILLPKGLVDEGKCSDIRAAITHELIHLRNHDLRWDAWIRLLCIVFWWHPLCWFARKAHRLSCEHVCDAISADAVGHENYKSSLARIALYANGLQELGFAMAKSEVMQRIAFLKFERSAGPLRAAGLIAGTCVIAVACLLGSAVFAARPQKISQITPSKVGETSTLNELEKVESVQDATIVKAVKTAKPTVEAEEEKYIHTATANLNNEVVTLERMPPKPDYEFWQQARKTRVWELRNGRQIEGKLGKRGETHISIYTETGYDKNDSQNIKETDVALVDLVDADREFVEKIKAIIKASETFSRIQNFRMREHIVDSQRAHYNARLQQEKPKVIASEWRVTKKILSLSPGTISLSCKFEFEILEPGIYAFPVRVVNKRDFDSGFPRLHSGGFNEVSIQFEIGKDRSPKPIQGRGFGEKMRSRTHVEGNTVFAEVDFEVRETPHSCIVLVAPNYPNRPLLPVPKNAVLLTLAQFLGDK